MHRLVILVSICIYSYIYLYHIVTNYSPSIPPGIYIALPIPPDLTQGDLVRARLPTPLQTPTTSLSAVLKRVGGRAGDTVCVDGTRLYRNHTIIDTHHSRYTPPHCTSLLSDQYYLYSEHSHSLDSRILGIFSRSQLQSIYPIFLP